MSKHKMTDYWYDTIGTLEDINRNQAEGGQRIYIARAEKAVRIADRLEQAKEDARRRKCKYCSDFDDCTEVNVICDKAKWYIDGYDDAITDIRGDTE